MVQTETIFRAMWKAATNDDNCGFSMHPAARACSICAILINKQLMTRGGSSTEMEILAKYTQFKADLHKCYLFYLLLMTNKCTSRKISSNAKPLIVLRSWISTWERKRSLLNQELLFEFSIFERTQSEEPWFHPCYSLSKHSWKDSTDINQLMIVLISFGVGCPTHK